MCLSTVYKNSFTPDAIVMRNVMSIECRDGMVIFTDLMERTYAIEGEIQKANLVEGFVIVKEKVSA
jgi:predicted RNA-binding protein